MSTTTQEITSQNHKIVSTFSVDGFDKNIEAKLTIKPEKDTFALTVKITRDMQNSTDMKGALLKLIDEAFALGEVNLEGLQEGAGLQLSLFGEHENG